MPHHKINYVELPAHDLTATKEFFEKTFHWRFEDYGPDYCAFHDAGLDGGFYRANLKSDPLHGGALVVLYSDTLEETLAQVQANGGYIVQAIFDFPGGRRFHFTEPSGNEFAVWGEAAESGEFSLKL